MQIKTITLGEYTVKLKSFFPMDDLVHIPLIQIIGFQKELASLPETERSMKVMDIGFMRGLYDKAMEKLIVDGPPIGEMKLAEYMGLIPYMMEALMDSFQGMPAMQLQMEEVKKKLIQMIPPNSSVT